MIRTPEQLRGTMATEADRVRRDRQPAERLAERASGGAGGGGGDPWFPVSVVSGGYNDARYDFVEQEFVRNPDGHIAVQDKSGGRSGVAWNYPEIAGQTHDLCGECDVVYTWAKAVSAADVGVGTTTAAPSTEPPATTEPATTESPGGMSGTLYIISERPTMAGGEWRKMYVWDTGCSDGDTGCPEGTFLYGDVMTRDMVEQDPPVCED